MRHKCYCYNFFVIFTKFTRYSKFMFSLTVFFYRSRKWNFRLMKTIWTTMKITITSLTNPFELDRRLWITEKNVCNFSNPIIFTIFTFPSNLNLSREFNFNWIYVIVINDRKEFIGNTLSVIKCHIKTGNPNMQI